MADADQKNVFRRHLVAENLLEKHRQSLIKGIREKIAWAQQHEDDVLSGQRE